MGKALAPKKSNRGRPPSLSKEMVEARKLAKQISQGRRLGWGLLAQAAPNLMQLAISKAAGDEEHSPDWSMVRFLLDLLNKLAGEVGETEEPAIAGLLKNLKANVANISFTQVNNSEPVAANSPGRNEVVEGVFVEGVGGGVLLGQ